MSVEKIQILECLKQVIDPELKRDIVSLGMIKEIQVQGNTVSIQLTMTSSSEIVRNAIRQQAAEKIQHLEAGLKVNIEISRASGQGTIFEQKNPLPGVQYVVAVSSGKGGVGKTTVAVNLAVALARLGHSVGLMDGDIYGPNVPLMLGVPPEKRPEVSDQELLIPLQAHGIKMISMGVLVPPDQPMVWRGPRLHGAVTQFLQKVDWGTLDFLLVDLPPGTGDVQLSLVQTVPLSGAVMVTMPQEVSLMDVRKGIVMFQKTQVPILGVIENMSGEIFGSGGGIKTAEQYHVPFLGSIPLEAEVRHAGDQGKPIVSAKPDSISAKGFMAAAENLVQTLQSLTASA